MKKFFSILIVITLLLSTFCSTFASEFSNGDKGVADKIEFISIKKEFDVLFPTNNLQTIKLNGVENNLLIEFSSYKDAIEKINDICYDLIKILRVHYELEPLSNLNWKEYYNVMFNALYDLDLYDKVNESDYEYRMLRAFFDIYENTEKNNFIKEAVNIGLQKTMNVSGIEKQTDEIIAENLPYNSAYSINYWNEKYTNYIITPYVEINLTPAKEYAINYAVNPNKDSYYYFSHGDCTNFVSQILEASGVEQEEYDSELSGWWHKIVTNWLGFKEHKHSRAWTMADVFARYMGVVYTTQDHFDFSDNISAGSIIGVDRSSDGDWEHIAFVTQVDSFIGSYDYYDYKVAQHTTNYHEWTSSTNNNWESAGIDGGTYARIRD